jgi:hypothetical protein
MDTFKVLKNFFSKSDETVANTSNNEEATNEIPSADEVLKNFMWCKSESLETLADFPLILPLFLKYNTDLLASAAAERLFSTARNVLKLNRCS